MHGDFFEHLGRPPDQGGGAGPQQWRLPDVPPGDGEHEAEAAPDAITNARSWNGRPKPTPTAAATSAATAMMPSANVVVASSATPSTAATISQTIHATMAAPHALRSSCRV